MEDLFPYLGTYQPHMFSLTFSLQVVNPILMCPKYMSYDSYHTCSYMQSGQLPLGLTCCQQQSSQASEPFLVCSKFSPAQHCFMMRSRQFLTTSIWAPFLLLAGNLWVVWCRWSIFFFGSHDQIISLKDVCHYIDLFRERWWMKMILVTISISGFWYKISNVLTNFSPV